MIIKKQGILDYKINNSLLYYQTNKKIVGYYIFLIHNRAFIDHLIKFANKNDFIINFNIVKDISRKIYYCVVCLKGKKLKDINNTLEELTIFIKTKKSHEYTIINEKKIKRLFFSYLPEILSIDNQLYFQIDEMEKFITLRNNDHKIIRCFFGLSLKGIKFDTKTMELITNYLQSADLQGYMIYHFNNSSISEYLSIIFSATSLDEFIKFRNYLDSFKFENPFKLIPIKLLDLCKIIKNIPSKLSFKTIKAKNILFEEENGKELFKKDNLKEDYLIHKDLKELFKILKQEQVQYLTIDKRIIKILGPKKKIILYCETLEVDEIYLFLKENHQKINSILIIFKDQKDILTLKRMTKISQMKEIELFQLNEKKKIRRYLLNGK